MYGSWLIESGNFSITRLEVSIECNSIVPSAESDPDIVTPSLHEGATQYHRRCRPQIPQS